MADDSTIEPNVAMPAEALSPQPDPKTDLEQCEEYRLGWQRALADYQNLKKETETRRGEWVQMSEQQILEEFIPVYDNLKLAFRLQTSDFSPEQQKWADGIKYIIKQFSDILRAHNVVEIKTVGEMFDPKFHETVGEEDLSTSLEASAPLREPGTIIREMDGGYTLGSRVIKPAKVIVAK